MVVVDGFDVKRKRIGFGPVADCQREVFCVCWRELVTFREVLGDDCVVIRLVTSLVWEVNE